MERVATAGQQQITNGVTTVVVDRPLSQAISQASRPIRRRQKEAWFTTRVWIHRPQLLNFMRHLNFAGQEAEDLCQETFLRIWRAYDSGNCRQPRSVVFKTARNLITDLARREAVANAALVLIDSELRDLYDCLDPLRQASGEWDLKRLSLALRKLSPIQRALVWYRRIEELSEKDAAKKLQINVDRVDNQLRWATRHLRSSIGGLGLESILHRSHRRMRSSKSIPGE
jgi:RNA polymerase sigma factor (sigma-70 family)